MFFKIFRILPLKIWLLILGLGLFFWLWIFGHQGLYELEHLRGLKAELARKQKSLLEERENLKKELKLLKDPRYQKHLIHKELGFVEPGEAIIKFQPKKKD